MKTKYTYDLHFHAHYGNGQVIIPDQVANDQRAWVEAGNQTFPAWTPRGAKVRVRLDPDAYSLFTTGTGDPRVKSA